MSTFYTYHDRTVWNPSVRVGDAFFMQIQSLETLIGSTSGIINTHNDEYIIQSATTLADFIQALLQTLHTTNNPFAPLLIESGCQILIAVHAQLHPVWMQPPPELQYMVERAQMIKTRMLV